MTRESIPDFDLYAELEIARAASPEIIEAAYRTLAKRHHPDVARPRDSERIKRLNVAREWLIDPDRRRRYDAAAGPAPKPARPPKARAARAAKSTADAAARSPGTSTAKAFGPYTDEVRKFLADLRALDAARAIAVRDGRAAIDPIAYAVARHVAFIEGRAARQDEWLLAREAASVIARGKLGNSPLTPVVSDVVADIAGAIAVRDRIPRNDFEMLLQPWVWRRDAGAPAGPGGPPESSTPQPPAAPARAAGPVPSAASVARSPAAARGRIGPGRRGASTLATPPAVLAIVALVALASMMLAFNGTRPEAAVAGLTDAPAAMPSPAPSVAASPLATAPAIAPPSGAVGSFTTGPIETSATEPSTGPGPGSTPRVTPRPSATSPTAVPSAVPTPVLSPSPTPIPSPSPPGFCQVISLIGENTANTQLLWNEAGFTGLVDFSPEVPPHYKVDWQSLNPGDSVPCTSGISVQKLAP